MKKRISKFFSGLLAVSLMLFSMPNIVYGVEKEIDGMVYKTAGGGAILTECKNTSAETITIPEYVTIGFNLKVVGIDDYAFGYCNNLTSVYIPSTLKNDSMGNVAFLTARQIVEFMNGELGKNASTEDVVRYVAKQINYNNGNWTDDDIDEITLKLMNHLNKVDTSTASTLEGKIMTLIKNIDQMGLSQMTLLKFDLWIATVKYSNMTVKGEADTEIQQYVNGRSPLGLKYEITSTYSLSQENCNLYYVKLDKDGDGTYDGISITGYSGNIQEVKVPDRIEKLPVVDIAENAFSNATNLNTIYLPKTITSVGEKSMGYLSDGTKIPGFIIYGYTDGSNVVERYALKNGFIFKDMLTVPVLSFTEVTLKIGEMIGLNVKNYEGDINWFSDDTTIATVSDGFIKGISGGEVTVYAELPDGTLLKCNVTIKSTPVISGIVTTGTVTTTGEPAISLTSKYTQPTTTTTAEPAISLTTKYTQPTTTTTAEPAISLTTKYTQPTTTTTAEPAISLTTKYTQSTTTATSVVSTTIVTKTSVTSTSVVSVTTTPIVSSKVTTTNPLNTSITSTSESLTITSVTIITSTVALTTVSTQSSVTDTVTASSASTTAVTTSTIPPVNSTSVIISSSVPLSSTSVSITPPVTTNNTTTITTSNLVTSSTLEISSTTTSITSTVNTQTTAQQQTSIYTSATQTDTTTSPIEQTKPVDTKTVYLGDANEDGKVDVRDAAYISKMLSIDQVYVLPFQSDFNQDEVINVRDAAALARKLAGGNTHWIQIIIKVYPV